MAFTFTLVENDPVAGVAFYTATTDTSSAAGSITPGFSPNSVYVYQLTTPITYRWTRGMTAAHMNKIIANGTQTEETTNGITVTSAGGSTTPTVTLGTGCHTNSASFVIELRR